MAGASRGWTKTLAAAAMLAALGLAQAGLAQTAPAGPQGALSGKLTDLYSAPLDGAAVVLRNEATGAEARATTGKNGSYRFAGLAAGEYTLEAESERLGRGRLEGIVVIAGHEERLQTAMQFEMTTAAASQGATTQARAGTPALHPAAQDLSAKPPAAADPEADKAMELRAAGLRRLADLARETPATANPVLTATVPEVPLASLPLTARVSPEPARPALAKAGPVGAAKTLGTQASSATVPIRLPAAVRAEPASGNFAAASVRPGSSGPGSIGLGSMGMSGLAAIAEAADSMQAAIKSSLLQTKAMAMVSRDADPVTPVAATTMTGGQLQALPASGRRWQDFVLDTPTAAASTASGSQASLRGAGQEPAETTIDGANIRLAFGGAGGTGEGSPGSESEQNAMGQAWAGGRGSPVAEAAIREVETAAGNVEAEGTRADGGRISLETERGGNGLHGQGFLFDRQNTWGARNPYTQWVTQTSEITPLAPYNTTPFPVFDNFHYSSGPNDPATNGPPQSYTPPDHEMVWGVGVGSQIRRDKLFWFAALDSYRRNDPGLAMVKHPLDLCGNINANGQCTYPAGLFEQPSNDELDVLCARLGLIEPGQTGPPKACTNAAVQALPKYSCMLERLAGTLGGASSDCQLVTPPSPQLGPTSPLLGPTARTATQWVGFGRLDWKAAERHRFTLEGIGATWNSPGGGLTRVSENYGTNSFGSSKASEEWLLGRWEAYLTPNLLVVTQGSAGRNILSTRPETPSAFEQTLLSASAYGQLPQIDVDNRYGFTIGNPSRFGQGSYPDERLYEAQEMLDWVRGSLLFKAGFDLSHNYDATSMLRNQTGTYTYSDVENFASDALAFAAFGINGQLNPYNQHNCDQTGKVWTDAAGTVRGLGYLPCYSSYSQTIGPTDWNLSTNDWAGYATAQWQPKKLLVLSAGLRWEREQMPPTIAALNNPQLPLTEKLPSLGNNWGPRVSLALGNAEGHWPVLRLGYGMYYGRAENSTIETALTQTGSQNGDMSFFLRPTDNLPNNGGGAPPFPYVLRGPPGSVVTPGAVEFAPNFRNPEVHQALVGAEEWLPGHVELTASAMVSLGRRLPVPIDANLATPKSTQTITYNVCDQAPSGANNGACGNLGLGPIKAAQITVPFYASWPSADCSSGAQLNSAGQCGWSNPAYQGINAITSKANSTYEAMMVKLVRYGRRGLTLHAHYTYSHAMDWSPNESPLDPSPANFSQEYGTSDLDMRHSAAAMAVYEAPWKLRGLAGKLANGWMLSGIGQFHSGLPYSMHTSGALAKEFTSGGSPIVGLGPGMNGSGGASRVYGVGSNGVVYNIGRNTFRYPATWKADMRLGKSFDLGRMRKLELLAESFNLFNHQNVTEIETTGYTIQSGSPTSAAGTLPALNYLTGLKINSTTGLPNPAFGQPLNVNATNFYRERQIQIGLRMRF